MNKSVLLIALILAPLSGCLGIPEGSIGPGSSVQAVATVTDADTGEVLLSNEALRFVVGQGGAGLGYEFERQLVGKPSDFMGTLTIRGDPSLQWSGTADAQARYESPLVQTIARSQYEPTFGTPTAGAVFTPQFSFFDYQVLSVDGDTITYKPIPEQFQRNEIPNVGAILVTSVEGDMLVQVLEPDFGATFQVLPPTQFNPSTPLGLAPGSYRTIGGDGETIVFEHSSSSNPDLVGRDLIITVTIQAASPSIPRSVEPVNGNYGVRQSSYINGVPSASVNFLAEESGHDDGHDHTH